MLHATEAMSAETKAKFKKLGYIKTPEQLAERKDEAIEAIDSWLSDIFKAQGRSNYHGSIELYSLPMDGIIAKIRVAFWSRSLVKMHLSIIRYDETKEGKRWVGEEWSTELESPVIPKLFAKYVINKAQCFYPYNAIHDWAPMKTETTKVLQQNPQPWVGWLEGSKLAEAEELINKRLNKAAEQPSAK